MNVEREGNGNSPQTPDKAAPPRVVKSALPASAPTPAAAAPARQPATQTANLQQILAQLNTTVSRPEKESNYTLSVLFVGAVMVALPLAYLLLVLLVMAVLFFIWPPLAIPVAVIVLVLMLKPLLAPSGRRSVTYSLIPDREPAMFQFVQRLCNAVGAPIPQRIDVSMDANASASFGKGDDLVLTIGLPLCAGLTLRQLAGVMAHEFGHFTQGSAMRLTYIVGHMNAWLIRIVTERDAWDLMLLRAINRGDFLTAIAAPIYGVIWLNRMMFYGIVMGGQLVCAHMLRQMEFDADRYEIQVAGSATFCETSLKLQPLMQAVNWAFEDLDQAWMEKRLSDNFPAMVIANVAQMEKNPAQVSAIRRAVLQTPTKLLDSHPSPSARIERANQLNAPGIMNVDAASSMLFANFDELCKGVTAEFYKKELGLNVESWNLVASETVISEQEMHNEAMKTLMRFFQGEIIGAYQIFPPAVSPESTEDPQQTLANLRSARQQMLAGLNQSVEILHRYRHADTWIREMTKAWVILESGFSFDPAQFGLPDANFPQVGHAREAARQDRDLNEQQLASAIQCAQVRMCSALQLLHVPTFAQRFNNVAPEIQRCAELQRTLAVLQQAWPGLKQMRDHTVTLELLLDVASEIGGHNPLYNRLFQECGQVARTLNEVRWKVSQVAYPFPHAHGHVTIGNYALAIVPTVDEPVQLYEAAHEMHDKLMNLYFRAMSYLAMTAEKVEDALGIDRLPDPFGSTWDPLAPSADITVQQPG